MCVCGASGLAEHNQLQVAAGASPGVRGLARTSTHDMAAARCTSDQDAWLHTLCELNLAGKCPRAEIFVQQWLYRARDGPLVALFTVLARSQAHLGVVDKSGTSVTAEWMREC